MVDHDLRRLTHAQLARVIDVAGARLAAELAIFEAALAERERREFAPGATLFAALPPTTASPAVRFAPPRRARGHAGLCKPFEIQPGRSVVNNWDRALFETWEERKARRAAERAAIQERA